MYPNFSSSFDPVVSWDVNIRVKRRWQYSRYGHLHQERWNSRTNNLDNKRLFQSTEILKYNFKGLFDLFFINSGASPNDDLDNRRLFSSTEMFIHNFKDYLTCFPYIHTVFLSLKCPTVCFISTQLNSLISNLDKWM